MSFSVEIQVIRPYGVECYRVEVGVICLVDGRATRSTPFLFDTGAAVTTVSEDIARDLGLPQGGRPVAVTGSVSSGTGRLIPIEFRFAGERGLVINSQWVVVPGDRGIAILGLRDVLPYFEILTEDYDLYFRRK